MSAPLLQDIDFPATSRSTRPAVRNPSLADTPAQTGEYSILGLARSADQSAVRNRQVGFTLVLFGVATIIALVYSVERYFYSRALGDTVSFVQLVPTELVFTYAWALLTPLAMYTAKRFPVWGRGRGRNWAVQLSAMIAFMLVHVAVFCAVVAAIHGRATFAALPRFFGESLLSLAVLDSLVYCVLVVVHHAVVYYRVSKDRALRSAQLESSLAQTQLHMLRMQLQPHFLFNTLHSISALMHKDVQRADSMVAALSDLLRLSLENIGAQEVPLQSELDFLQRYTEIMSIRFGDRLQVSLDVDPNVRDARVPNLFLQPLVENSFRHGFGDLGQGSIAIRVRRDGDMLRCDVIDDGRGLRAGHKEGVGLASTRQRLTRLYGERHAFAVRGSPGEGVRVSLAIPYHSYEHTAAD
ncbi:MAG TPA: histidine kinase [Gemmatimonadaceae bacterium]|jgi:two-component sensor histidine kinase